LALDVTWFVGGLLPENLINIFCRVDDDHSSGVYMYALVDEMPIEHNPKTLPNAMRLLSGTYATAVTGAL